MVRKMEQQWMGGELLISALLGLVIVRIAYKIDRSSRPPLLSTAAWAVILGLAFGFILAMLPKKRASDMRLNPETIFFGVLPPIVLDAGFSTHRRGFFAHFVDVFLLGIVGTIGTVCLIGTMVYWLGQSGVLGLALSPAESILYGSLISAIDPVATQLVLRKSCVPTIIPELVFGERSLNNAISIAVFNLCQSRVEQVAEGMPASVLFTMLAELIAIAFGSMVLVAIVGFTSAYILRSSDDALKSHQPYEISILLLTAYACYMAGELLQLSGHVAVFFCGAFIRHYHIHSISKASSTTFRHLLPTLAFLAENFIFLYLGISVFAFSDSFAWDWRFIVGTFVICLVTRALTTFPLCALASAWRLRRIPVSYMLVIWLSGLRGAIAFALALNVKSTDHAAVIRSATIFTVLTTTILFTLATRPLLNLLGLVNTCHRHAEERLRERHMTLVGTDDYPSRNQGEDAPLLSSSEEEIAFIRDKWEAFDREHLQPVFGGAASSRTTGTPAAQC
ncbi:TPA: hypothetical protein N0F65_009891 [Lagenidium giganteum]|uniref:Sodium/hydrogen exchanger n=1 Tax=Lagenidium giganteum TaxID=4803 RepID=A0AAV2YTN0_9STRA|nr:TPA: hypothetical protein N0F65_009891 [Lagenidium giganteum]